MKLYAGIDLHSNNSMVAIIDEQDRVVLQKRFANDLKQILLALASFEQHLRGVVVESTYNWYWLVDGLMEAGYTVHLANTAAIVQYEGLKYSADEHDARWLAHLLIGDFARGIYLSARGARGTRSDAPAHATGANAQRAVGLHAYAIHAQHGEQSLERCAKAHAARGA